MTVQLKGMRILVAIASHGHKNRAYLDHLLNTYRAFEADVDLVVLSDGPKDLGDDVEVRIGAPTKDPWSLPFAHRPLFVERAEQYDLFIYSEDDTEITEDHVAGFLECCADLPGDRIAGFVRHEYADDGTRFCSTVHGPYYWDPSSVMTIGEHVYATYTNAHSAAYILTREHLSRCIASGGFTMEPHKGRYDMLCSAATDPYTRCGLEKVVRISEIARFSLHHLPDIYLGRIGKTWSELETQIDSLMAIAQGEVSRDRLFPTRIGLDTLSFDKSHDEPERAELVAWLARSPGRVLSIGCEEGRTEGALVENGCAVTAVPIDAVVGATAAARGVHVLAPDLNAAVTALGAHRFDYIIFNNVLSYMPDPVATLRQVMPLAAPGGEMIVTGANANSLRARKIFGRIFGVAASLSRPQGRLERAGYQPTTVRTLRRWLAEAGMTSVSLLPSAASPKQIAASGMAPASTSSGPLKHWQADWITVSGRKTA